MRNIIDVFKRSRRSPPPHDQQSRLLSLPAELRQQIWIEALRFPDDAKPAHFHVYDKVYDSCLYDHNPVVDGTKRKAGAHTALLRTCRLVYNEAVQPLYDTTEFELVVLAGFVRPGMFQMPDGKRYNNIAPRNCIGSISRCSQLKRTRNIKLVLQPGRKPDAEKYQQRLEKVLHTLRTSTKLRNLSIKLNLGRARRDFDLRLPARLALNQYLEAFAVLAPPALPAKVTVTLQPCRIMWNPEAQEVIEEGTAYLQKLLSIPDEHVTPWTIFTWSSLVDYDFCIQRGAFGEKREGPTPNLALDLTMLAAILVLSPILVPYGFIAERERKRNKGEKWTIRSAFWRSEA